MEQNQTTRILGRVVAREITAEETETVSGGLMAQTVKATYNKDTGELVKVEQD